MISYWGISLLIFSVENTWYRSSEYQYLSLDISYYRTATRRISATAWSDLIRLFLRSYFQFLFSIYFSDYCLLTWGFFFWKSSIHWVLIIKNYAWYLESCSVYLDYSEIWFILISFISSRYRILIDSIIFRHLNRSNSFSRSENVIN